MMRPFVRQSDMPECLSFTAISKVILLQRCTSKSYLGKLLVCTIATLLRLMMMSRAQTNAKTAGLKILKDSMDVFMAKMRGIKAEKR